MSFFNDPAPHIIHLHETESTNRYLQERLSDDTPPTDGTIVVSDFQTGGRGQVGNTWESEAGRNLTFSLLYTPTAMPANCSFRISQIAALSVKYTLDRYTTGITVKWPNDVYWHDRKICGMLIENILEGRFVSRSIIGIGLNLNQITFRSDAPNPISLTQITGQHYDPSDVLQRWYEAFLRLRLWLEYAADSEDDIHSRYLRALYRRDGFHPYADADGPFSASIEGIEPTGHLRLRRPDGRVSRYAFKEVRFLPETPPTQRIEATNAYARAPYQGLQEG